MKTALTVLTLPFLAFDAVANEAPKTQAWASLGIMAGSVDSQNGIGSNDDLEISQVVELSAGIDMGNYFGFEGQLSIPTKDDKVSRNDKELNVGLNSGFGVFGRLRYPVSDTFEVYAKGGFAQFSFDVRDPDFGNEFERTKEIDDNGLAIGGGVRFYFDTLGKNAVKLEFIDYSWDKTPTQTFSIAYVRKF